MEHSESDHGIPSLPIKGLPAFILGVVMFGLLYIYISQFKSCYIDDAFIQLLYSYNLNHYGNWGFLAERISNTATSPLNVILTAGFGLLPISLTDAVVWLTSLEFLFLLVLLLLISRNLFDGYFFGCFAFIAFLSNPLLMSTIGLESILFTLLVVASLYFFLLRKWYVLSVTLGLLMIARPDGFLLFLVVLFFLPLKWRAKSKFILVYILTLLPWYLYSWIHLGSFVPDTFFIKLREEHWKGIAFQDGPGLYLRRYPLAFLLSIWTLPLGLFSLWRNAKSRKTIVLLLLCFGTIHFAAYSLMGVPPYHWYYTIELICCILIGSIGAANLVEQLQRPGKNIRIAILCCVLLIPMAGMILLLLREGLPLNEVPIHTNHATEEQYSQISLWLKENLPPKTPILMAGEIGTLGYFSQQYLINDFSTMKVFKVPAGRFRGLPLVESAMRLNFYWRRNQEPLSSPLYRLRFSAREKKGDNNIQCWETSTQWIQTRTICLQQIQ